MKKLRQMFKRLIGIKVEYYYGGDSIPFTSEASWLIRSLKDFDEADCRRWFLRNVSIGSKNILEYIKEKDKIKGGK